MNYRIHARTSGGSVVTVIVETEQAGLVKIQEYQEEGFNEIGVKDMDGAQIEIAQFVRLATVNASDVLAPNGLPTNDVD